MSNNDRINALAPGGRVELSSSNGVSVVAERSGNGETMRIVRECGSGYTIVTSMSWR